MKRQHALDYAKFAGYHNDSANFTQLLIEARVSRQAMNDAWRLGAKARQNGMRCECFNCKRAS